MKCAKLRRMRDMLYLRKMVVCFHAKNRPQSNSVPNWVDEVSRGEFLNFVKNEKHVFEDWHSTLERWYFTFSSRTQISSTAGLARSKAHSKRLNDLLDEAIEKNYILIASSTPYNAMKSETILTTDWRGRRFVKMIPFIEATARDSAFFASVLTSFVFGAGGTYILLYSWETTRHFLGL